VDLPVAETYLDFDDASSRSVSYFIGEPVVTDYITFVHSKHFASHLHVMYWSFVHL